MKMTAQLIKNCITILSLFYISSCTKTDSSDLGEGSVESNSNKQKNICDVAEFNSLTPGQLPLAPYVFHKKYSPNGKKISQIDIGLYSGGTVGERVLLNVSYKGKKIYFINNANPSDTCIKATLNNFGKPATASFSNTIDFGLPDHTFLYDENGRLVKVVVDQESNYGFWFHYDARGNNTVISLDTIDQAPAILETFQYDNSRAASQQLYLDHARGFSEDGFLAFHAMGLLPELNPVNIRTHTRVMWGPYQAYDADLFNHKLDNEGKLLGYDAGLIGSASSSWSLVWQCQGQNQNQGD